MQRIHNAISLLLASVCLVFFVMLSVSAGAQETVEFQKGDFGKAASFSYIDKDSKPLTLDPSKAKLTALHFWATWCVPCVDELPTVDDEQGIFGKNLQIVPVALDGKNIDKVQKFFAAHKIKNLPVLLDPTAKTSKTAGLQGLPGTIFIDPKGNIIARADGPLDWQQPEVSSFIKAQLAK